MVYRYLKNLNLSVRIKIMPNQILARKEELLDKKTREKNNNFEEENFKKSDIQNSVSYTHLLHHLHY